MSNQKIGRQEFVVPVTTKQNSKIKQVAIYSGVILGLFIVMTGTVSAFTSPVEKKQAEFDVKFEQLVKLEADTVTVKDELYILEEELAVEKLKELGNIKMGDMTTDQREDYSRLELKVQPLEVGVAFEPITSFPQV